MNRGKKMLALLIVLAVMLGGYYAVQQSNKTTSVSETSGTFDLTAKTADDLTGISWTTEDTTLSFILNEAGEWETTDTPAWPVDQSAVQTLADKLLALQGTRKLEDVTSLADYGLDAPTITVTATWKDASTTTYTMGDATPFADGYYLKLSTQDNVIYTIATSLSTTFNKTQKELVAMEEIPTISEASSITVGTTFAAVKKSESITVNPDQLWYDAATDAPLTASKVEALVSAAKAIAWDELVTAVATEDELTGYQLDEANATIITMTGDEDASMTLLIGGEDGAGNRYARLPGSSMVYTVEADDVSSLLSANSDDMWISALVPLPWSALKTATLETGKGTYTIVKAAEETEATATDTEETTDDSEADETLWNKVTALTATDRLSEATDGDTVLTITAQDDAGRTITVVIREYSADSYQAQVDGEKTLLISADTIDTLVRTIKSML